MSRLLRILLNTATVLSLVLCVAVLLLWGWAIWHPIWTPRRTFSPDPTGFHWEQGGWGLDGRGFATFAVTHEERLTPSALARGELAATLIRGQGNFQLMHYTGPDRMRFAFGAGSRRSVGTEKDGTPFMHGKERFYQRCVPFYQAFLIAAALPIAVVLHAAWRQWRRPTNLNLCQHCGYDCRATPDRCPECGRIPAASRAR